MRTDHSEALEKEVVLCKQYLYFVLIFVKPILVVSCSWSKLFGGSRVDNIIEGYPLFQHYIPCQLAYSRIAREVFGILTALRMETSSVLAVFSLEKELRRSSVTLSRPRQNLSSGQDSVKMRGGRMGCSGWPWFTVSHHALCVPQHIAGTCLSACRPLNHNHASCFSS